MKTENKINGLTRFFKKNEYYVRLEIIIDKKAGEYVMSQELEKTY